MKKIIIVGTGRTASKLYREVLNQDNQVYILHEIMFDFICKTDIHFILKKYNVYTETTNISDALNEIYEKPFFKNFQNEFPDKEAIVNEVIKRKEIDWYLFLDLLFEIKKKHMNKSIIGAKHPVHFSFTPKLLQTMKDIKVIYLMRDPRSVYASEIPMKSKQNKLSQFPRVKNRIMQRIIIFVYVNIEWIWAFIIYKRIHKNVLLCKYEDLINNPLQVFQSVFHFCNLHFKNEYLHQLKVINSSHIDNDRGISKHGISKWRNVLNWFEKFWFNMLIIIFNY